MNPLQRASRNRKVIYFGLIAALFTLSMVWRGLIPVPLGTSAARFAQPFRWAEAHTVQSQAQRLEVWESDPTEGEADITGSAARLALTGSRGVAVTVLWLSAIEKQKRNDFHEFEQRVTMVTKLQPNFITPWIFQSWNIAYNVSVEMHGSGDMYYYIVRGIQLLAEGERRNKRSPDMRYQIAFYYQNKFGVSDQVDVLRCLFDLSCIPPNQRDPDALMKPKPRPDDPNAKELDVAAFKKFCTDHPHLVRRLRGEDIGNADKKAKEKLRLAGAEQVVQFLRTNRDVPNRYRGTGDDLKDAGDPKAFPVLPPKFPTESEEFAEADPGSDTRDDFVPALGYFSAYKVARAWFSYSLLLLPPPMRDDAGKTVPSATPRPGEFGHDPSKHRVPRLPMMILFRQGAPRAQSYAAELEQKEGWFDREPWTVTFTDPADTTRLIPVTIGAKLDAGGKVIGERDWSREEWDRAATMWAKHGTAYGLSLTETQLSEMNRYAVDAASMPPDPSPEQMADPTFRRRFFATTAKTFYDSNRATTNFPIFLASAEAEANRAGDVRTVDARKVLWKAEQARKNGKKAEALALYKEGLDLWKKVLEQNPQYHRLAPPANGNRGEEEACEFELTYQRLLVSDDQRVRDRANLYEHAIVLAHAVVPFVTRPLFDPANPQWSSNVREELKWFVVETTSDSAFNDLRDEAARKLVVPGETPAARDARVRAADAALRKREDFSSPFVDPANPERWVREFVRDGVRVRQGITRRQQPPPPGAPGPGGPPGGPGDPPG
ncbi:MAG: hypothetical protein FJ304_18215 [Planctomycetes bacterium]|nr:hypothetical protein [Planctomycetota bacterium]